MTKPILFIDDGGVMNDNRVRGPQWQRLVADYFTPRLGGAHEAWAQANSQVMYAILEPGAWHARLQAARDYAGFERRYYLDWLGDMCALVGVQTPPEEESLVLARECSAWVIRQVRSYFPGVVDTIRLLHERGYTLYTASGEASYDLEGYLEPMGVRDCFQRLYGTDLIDTFKDGPEFYERIFADAGVSPSDAIVVDDSHAALGWAAQMGARTVHITDHHSRREGGPMHALSSLSEFPALLEKLES